MTQDLRNGIRKMSKKRIVRKGDFFWVSEARAKPFRGQGVSPCKFPFLRNGITCYTISRATPYTTPLCIWSIYQTERADEVVYWFGIAYIPFLVYTPFLAERNSDILDAGGENNGTRKKIYPRSVTQYACTL